MASHFFLESLTDFCKSRKSVWIRPWTLGVKTDEADDSLENPLEGKIKFDGNCYEVSSPFKGGIKLFQITITSQKQS